MSTRRITRLTSRRRRCVAVAALAMVSLTTAACAPVLKRDAKSAATPPPLGPPPAAFNIPPVTTRTLPNGLTLLVAEYREVPIAVFHLVVRAGAAHDPAAKAGLAELTSSLLKQGTRSRRAEELAREIEFLGGAISSDVGYDFASVSGEFLSKDFDRGLELFADVALRPAFRAEEFRRAQALTLAGIVSSRDSPSSIADRCYQPFLYGTHPYGHATSGSEPSVRRVAPADVQAFYRRHYDPRGAVLVVIGGAPAAKLADQASRAFAEWRPSGEPPPPLPSAPRVQGRKLLLVDKPDATQAHIRVGNVAYARTDDAYVPGTVTSAILGGGFGSRLIDELRVKRSLTYGASSMFVARTVPGDFRVGTFTKVETTGDALAVTLDVLEQFASSGPTEVELERSRSLITGQYPLGLETPNAIAGRIAELQAFGLPLSDVETFPRRVLAVDTAAVSDISRRYVAPDDAAIVIVGPAAQIAPQLERFGIAVERTTPERCDGTAAR